MENLYATLPMLIKIVVIVVELKMLPIPLTWLERKIAGHIQQRPGLMRVGWHGILQPVADTVKLLTKEDHIPSDADRFLFKIAPVVALVPPCVVFVAIPIGEPIEVFGTEFMLSLSNMNVGLLFILAISSIGVYGMILTG